MGDHIDEVLDFWFGALDASGRADDEHERRWWRKDPAFDQQIQQRFGDLHAAVLRGDHDEWLTAPRGRLAFVIVLDQLSRNMFRDTARMFEGDARALVASLAGVARGDDRQLAFAERQFFYMPLMHAEDLATQDRALALFTAWRDEQDGPARDAASAVVGFAEKHRDIVRRFGRFPHRNALVGRASTPEEVAFLAQPGSSF
jgi:uncharacterized protein (DUF924 family)